MPSFSQILLPAQHLIRRSITLTKVIDCKMPTSFPSSGSLLDFFRVQDGLQVTWYRGANSREEMEKVFESGDGVIVGDVTLRRQKLPSELDEPVMTSTPTVNPENTLDTWLNNVLATHNMAPKLEFKVEDSVEPALQVLASKADKVRQPIWANADVLTGPGSPTEPINATKFLDLVQKYFPNMTLSLGWTTGCCDEMFTMPMMEEMWSLVENLTQPCSFRVRAALLKSSWPVFRWLLLKDTDRFSLTVWTPRDDMDWEGASPYDLLYVRNDIDKKLVFYDLGGPKFEEFRRLCITAGSPLNQYDLNGTRDGLLVSWAHAVNSKQRLEEAVKSDVMMLEADVLLEGQGTINQTTTPIMAHPPEIYSDITLEQWVSTVINTSYGMKLDFKSTEVLKPAMDILATNLGCFQQPIWINADIFDGPNAVDTPVNAKEFQKTVLEIFPQATLSLGWTTEYGPECYSKDMVDEMLAFVDGLQQPITFPVRASFVKKSWPNLERLLSASRAHTLTIWAGEEDIDPDDLVYVREHTDPDRVYYDLPDALMKQFLDRLAITK